MTTSNILLSTERLVLRNWIETDRNLFHEINADSKVMEFFPWRRTRDQSNDMFEKVCAMIHESGLGFYAMALKETDEPMGFCGLSRPNLEPIFAADTVEIGWRLATRFWGNGFVTEAAHALLDYGFADHDLTEIVSFAVPANRRSTAVMERIGMRRDPKRDFEHPRVPDTHPQLKAHVVYALSAAEWQAIHPIRAE